MAQAAEVLTDEQMQSSYPIEYAHLSPLIRKVKGGLDGHLEKNKINVKVGDTNGTAHCYSLALDGNGRVRSKSFARLLANHVTNFCIPRTRISKAILEAAESGSTESIDELNLEARSLFTKAPKSGEGGEIILSVLAEHYLGLPQLFTKMVLKTSENVHVHGSDGIHIGVNSSTDTPCIYWGESKMHKSPSNAARECIEGLAKFFQDSGGSKSADERDLGLMRQGLDLNDPLLEKVIRAYLDPKSTFYNALEFRGLGLVAYDIASYPDLSNKIDMAELKSSLEKEFNTRISHAEKRIKEENLQSFVLELFFLPFPSVESFREYFRAEIGLS